MAPSRWSRVLLGLGAHWVGEVRGSGNGTSLWTVIVDAGSTGSRLWTYHIDGEGSQFSGGVRVRRGDKVKPGLATFAEDHGAAYDQLLGLFVRGAHLVPKAHQPTARAIIRGTGGLRDELDAARRNALLETVSARLGNDTAFPFSIQREDVGVVSGHDESFYAFASANFLEGTVDHKLRRQTELIGALDLGGSSTQITYAYERRTECREEEDTADEEEEAADHEERAKKEEGLVGSAEGGDSAEDGGDSAGGVCGLAEEVGRDELYTRSFAGFGAQAVKERAVALNTGDADPCAHVGFENGAGDFAACVHAVRRALYGPERADECGASVDVVTRRTTCALGDSEGVAALPNSTRFLAMCNFFYAADALRVLSDESDLKARLEASWPTPPLELLADVAAEFCSLPWDSVWARKRDLHPYTPDSLLSTRCFEAAYILVLLRDAYALDAHEDHADRPRVTFALDAKGGAEVEWTLGFFLAEVAHLADHPPST